MSDLLKYCPFCGEPIDRKNKTGGRYKYFCANEKCEVVELKYFNKDLSMIRVLRAARTTP